MKYRVTLPSKVWVTVDVEAESQEEAEEIAIDEGSISGYCGNFGTDKLIGVSGDNASIEANCEPIYNEIEIEELE